MKKVIFIAVLAMFGQAQAQSPAITSWLQNTTMFGSYYTGGNYTAIPMTVLANCQEVSYSNNWVYVKTRGIPAYPTGIFTGDGNTNVAGDQNAIYKFPLNPAENTGTPTATTGGNIGVFINGVSLFDYRDGVAYNANATNGICGGPPPNGMCPGGPGTTQAWNRDAVPAERLGFDCSKGHPAGTNYHHHQNPSAFKYDSETSLSYSAICDLYDSDGLYTIVPTEHSPLIGFAYDGFPIYGAYGYANTDGTGEITRMKSSYQLSSNTTRVNGPNVNQVIGTQTFFNGYFREDYVYTANAGQDYLDEHNGRFCVTPEYPNGIYCYFTTVNADNSSAYPYAIGPTFYGNKTAAKVTSISEAVTVYTPAPTGITQTNEDNLNVTVFPNPSADFIALQVNGLVKQNIPVSVYDATGKLVSEGTILAGTTIWYLDTKTLYDGTYIVKVGTQGIPKLVVLARN
jgi:hypothetical protein